MLLPHRFAIGCEDGLADPEGIGWIVRQDQVIAKLNGLPESVQDRTRDSHEMFFHMVKQERYFSATDEIREPQTGGSHTGGDSGKWTETGGDQGSRARFGTDPGSYNPLGKLPGSVWSVASEPFIVPPDIKARYDLPDHFAAFVGGTELVRRIMLGWSPHAICLTCGEGRRSVVEKTSIPGSNGGSRGSRLALANEGGDRRAGTPRQEQTATILGYSCACTPFTDHPGSGERKSGNPLSVSPGDHARSEPVSGGVGMNARTGGWREHRLEGWMPPPSRPAVVVDPFVGSGTTLLVANALGRTGVGIDMSASYCRLAAWRASQRSEKVVARTWKERQQSLL
jgi:hypothetical protein